MAVVDKRNSLDHIFGSILELGCGNLKRNPDAVGIDAIDYDCVDLVGDAFEVLRLIPDNSVSGVSSEHFLEHIEDVSGLLDEIARILQPGGKLEIVVPHFSNPYYFSDLTHRSIFGLYSMSYFAISSPFRRTVPHYNRRLYFQLESVSLGFKSARPFYFRHGFKRTMQILFNVNTYMQEFYEENISSVIPCYEIRYRMTKISAHQD